MAYRNKEDCMRIAEEMGIDVADMTWPQLQKAVSDALKGEIEEAFSEAVAKPKKASKQKKSNPLEPYLDKTILMSPELNPERYRLVKYDEVLGNELDVVERSFDIDRNTDQVFDVTGDKVEHETQIDQYHDYTTGTFRIKARGDRKVIGMASVPKENPMLSFRPGMDWATVVTFQGKSGYLWKHWRYPNVSALLKEAGDEYYEKYRKLFKDQPNVWYACGHLVCNPYLVHRVLKEIEEDAAHKAIERKAMNERLGIGGPIW